MGGPGSTAELQGSGLLLWNIVVFPFTRMLRFVFLKCANFLHLKTNIFGVWSSMRILNNLLRSVAGIVQTGAI